MNLILQSIKSLFRKISNKIADANDKIADANDKIRDANYKIREDREAIEYIYNDLDYLYGDMDSFRSSMITITPNMKRYVISSDFGRIFPGCMYYGNNVFVVSNYDGNKIAYSSNAVDWTVLTPSGYTQCKIRCFGNGLFILDAKCDGQKVLLYSTDGASWNAAKLSGDWSNVDAILKCRFCKDRFIGYCIPVSGDNYIPICSYDGINWAVLDNGGDLPNILTSYSNINITYGKDKFIIGYSDIWPQKNINYIWYSTDGTNWSSVTVSNTSGIGIIKDCFYLDDKFVMLCQNAAFYSYDGVTWSRCSNFPSDVTNTSNYVTGFSDVYYTFYGSKAVVTTDGINWTAVDSPGNFGDYAICYGANKIVIAVSNSSRPLWISYDYTNWRYADDRLDVNGVDVTDTIKEILK